MRYADNLSAGAKLLYAEISSLTDARGYCFASNAYFCELYGISEDTVQRYLRALKKTGFIRIEDGDGGTGRRKIYAGANPLLDNPRKNAVVPDDPRKNAVETPANLQPPNNESNKKDIIDPPISPETKKSPMPAELMQRVESYAGEDTELLEALVGFAEQRCVHKPKPKPITTSRQLTLLLSKLNELSGGSRTKKLALIEKATISDWLSFFPLHEDHAIRLPREPAPSYEPEVTAWQ